MLIEYPNPILEQIAEPLVVDEFNSEWLADLVKKMEETIRQFDANGLAAPQIGVSKAVIICRDRHGLLRTLCNPEIIARSGKVKSYGEGCLSSPGFRTDLRRSKIIKVKAQTVEGAEVIFKEQGFPAIILQHEIDHVNGILLISRASGAEKLEYEKERKQHG